MKSERKKRIRAMLAAEGLSAGGKAKAAPEWNEFKKHLQKEFLAAKPPRLEIENLTSGFGNYWRWVVPAFAAAAVAVTVTVWQKPGVQKRDLAGMQSDSILQAATRTMKKGDVYTQGKREIQFQSGTATMTTAADGKIQIVATELRADFRLGEKVSMQILHPLLTVTITGTQFVFEAKAQGGVINLKEGSLNVVMHGLPAAEPVQLRAPVRFIFSKRGHQLVLPQPQSKNSGGKTLYRYDLTDGETFFAWQVRIDKTAHVVEILGGKKITVPVENIVRVKSAGAD